MTNGQEVGIVAKQYYVYNSVLGRDGESCIHALFSSSSKV